MPLVRHIALSLVWNASLVYVLPMTLTSALGARMSVIALFQPDIGRVA